MAGGRANEGGKGDQVKTQGEWVLTFSSGRELSYEEEARIERKIGHLVGFVGKVGGANRWDYNLRGSEARWLDEEDFRYLSELGVVVNRCDKKYTSLVSKVFPDATERLVAMTR